MTLWPCRRKLWTSYPLILFLFPLVLLLSGQPGVLNKMEKQGSEVICHCSQGWSTPSIVIIVLEATIIFLVLGLCYCLQNWKNKGQHSSGESESSLLLAKHPSRSACRYGGDACMEPSEIPQGFEGPLENIQSNLRLEQSPPADPIGTHPELLEKMTTQHQKEKEQLQAQHQKEKEQLMRETKYLEAKQHKRDVTLDTDTAHPRLEVSDDGKRMKDTCVIKHLPSNPRRFDSHLFVLAKQGYTSGRHFWEVEVGDRRSWALGIARESVTRKGMLSLSPKNGFWAMGTTDGQDHWAYSDPWTRLSVSGKLQKVGIFLDIPAKQLLFYHVQEKVVLYTFSLEGEKKQEGKVLPFFSTGPAAAKPDMEPLKIVQDLDDE